MIKYETRHKSDYDTTFGSGGYTVYKILTDTSGDTYYVPIADFKYKTDAEVFRRAKTNNEETN